MTPTDLGTGGFGRLSARFGSVTANDEQAPIRVKLEPGTADTKSAPQRVSSTQPYNVGFGSMRFPPGGLASVPPSRPSSPMPMARDTARPGTMVTGPAIGVPPAVPTTVPSATVACVKVAHVPRKKEEVKPPNLEPGLETDLYKFSSYIAGRCSLSPSDVWNQGSVDTQRYENKVLNKINFAKNYWLYVSAQAFSTMDSSIAIVRKCDNRVAKSIVLLDIVSSPSSWTHFADIFQSEYTRNHMMKTAASGRYETGIRIMMNVNLTQQICAYGQSAFERVYRSSTGSLEFRT